MSKRRNKRMRRYLIGRYSKPWSVGAVNTGRFPPKQELWFHGSPSPITPQREKYLNKREEYIALRFKTLFKIDVERVFRPASPVTKNDDPYLAVQQALAKLEQINNEPEVIDRRVTLVNSPVWRLELFYSENHRRYLFIEFDGLKRLVRESIVYRGRERAMFAYERKVIVWLKTTVLPPDPH